MMGLPYGEEIMIVGRTMWTQSTSVSDRKTDRRTDGRTELRSQRPCNAERRTVKIDPTVYDDVMCRVFEGYFFGSPYTVRVWFESSRN